MSWESYFFDLASVVAKNSKCFSRQIGAILVKDKTVISTGYNGPPREVPHCGSERFYSDTKLRKIIHEAGFEDSFECPRKLFKFPSGEGLHLCPATHAEANCIANAARLGINTKDSWMYVTCGVPCKNCLALIINAGIQGVVCTSLTLYDDLSEYILKSSDLIIQVYGGLR